MDADLKQLFDKYNKGYLSNMDAFGGLHRLKPAAFDLPEEQQRAAGLHPDTWTLEIVPDVASKADVRSPLTRASETALTFADLNKLAQTRTLRFIKTITCTLGGGPFGTALWEGVPLRDLVLMAKPGDNIRRVYFYGFHNDNPKQLFRSSLSLDRVLENPMGEYPVIVAFKCNGKPITVKAGGPVRMIVPECYGNRNIKYLNTIVLSANYRGNDSYAGGTGGGNDTESPMKSCVYSITVAPTSPADKPIAICGRAQVGTSGLSKVQYSISPVDQPPTPDDPWLTRRAWTDAEIAPPPETWGGQLPNEKLPEIPLQFDLKSSAPLTWPLRYTVCLWGAIAPGLKPGSYKVYARTIDSYGIAQPLPRPVDKFSSSGQNDLRSAPILVT